MEDLDALDALSGEALLPRQDRPDIGASELADYAYCHRSWWLQRRQGVRPASEALQEGVEAHRMHGVLLERAVQARWAERASVLVLVMLLGVLAVMGLVSLVR